MNTYKIYSLISVLMMSFAQGQDINQIKKVIDAEQYEKAKVSLKTMINSDSNNGLATFLLGNIYIKQEELDSAKLYYDKGLKCKNDANFNYIGIGHLELIKKMKPIAELNFKLAMDEMGKKEIDEYVYIAYAHMRLENPDYKLALSFLERAKAVNPTDPNVLLAFGDAYFGEKNQNDAYKAYRDAFQADNTMIRAKMQLGVLLKGAKAYGEALKAFNEVIALNPNYGPVYRELAETYYYWANNEPKNYDAYIKKALENYGKYMSLTDYSLNSRMRYADFLILARDYKALEIEAQKMKELDKVNPRILRYLGYSAYENGNTELAIKSINEFIANPKSKVIPRDYLYLGLSKLKASNNTATSTVDEKMFNSGIEDIKKAVELDINLTNDLGELGKKFYEQKLFTQAAAIYEIATTNENSKNNLLDNFYLGNSIYFSNAGKESDKVDIKALEKADLAFGKVIKESPTTQDAYLYRARTNRLMDKDDMMVTYYLQYIDVVTKKGPESIEKSKSKLVESYNNIASSYANTDKAKAVEFFNKTLAVDPTNEFAISSLKILK